jgi:predicted AAA+ superfamily ATPase
LALTEKGYRRRLADVHIRELLGQFGAVLIEGPKWCGKTWTALNHGNSVFFLTDPEGNFRNLETARYDPSLVLEGKAPLVIDEWQEVPGIWDAVRHRLDRGKERGRFILTGSSVPSKTSYVHSGAGRIAKIRMRTMSLFESGDSNGKGSLQRLFAHKKIIAEKSSMTLDAIIRLCLRGGWPAETGKSGKGYNDASSGIMARQYLERLVEKEVSGIDGSRRNVFKFMALIHSLARNNASMVSNKTLQSDIYPEALSPWNHQEEISINRNTVSVYLALLRALYVLEEIPGWGPGMRSSKRLRLSPKRFLADPSLAAAAMNARADRLKKDLETLGFIFEGLCLRDLLIYAESSGGRVYHYRDETGLEADAVIEAEDGQWAALEIKLGAHQIDAAAASLLKLSEKMWKNKIAPPAFLCVISGLCGFMHQREDGVWVIPIDCLGP